MNRGRQCEVRVSCTVPWEGGGEIPLPDPIGLNSKMAKQNPWIIGILGFGVFLYLAWNNFEIKGFLKQ